MLVLTRKPNETIRIGDAISLRVISVNGSSAKLGIEAPPNVSIHRGEVYERIQQENRRAARQLPTQLPQLARQWRESAVRRTKTSLSRGGSE